MPNERIHTTVNFFVLILIIAIVYLTDIIFFSIKYFILSFIVATLFFSPDLDLYYSCSTRRWGPLKIIWYPYSLMMKHRGASHNIFLGPLILFVYLSIILYIVYLLLSVLGYTLNIDISLIKVFVINNKIALLTGFFSATFFHLLLDKIF